MVATDSKLTFASKSRHHQQIRMRMDRLDVFVLPLIAPMQ